jgi:ADP-ribosylation factor-binding protein GGA
MKVRLQPASRSDLPVYNPILPVSAITQVMLIANPNKVNIFFSF